MWYLRRSDIISADLAEVGHSVCILPIVFSESHLGHKFRKCILNLCLTWQRHKFKGHKFRKNSMKLMPYQVRDVLVEVGSVGEDSS